MNKVMDVIGFEYPDYKNHVANIEAGEKRKRVAKATCKALKKVADDGTKNDESDNDEESPSGAQKRIRLKFL
jgi:phosphosulfolactate synthase (CoM biosynthesis protein A)